MIKEIKIYNRFNMDTFAKLDGLNFPYKCWYLISIHSGDILINPHVRKVFEKIGCKGMLSLEFWDMLPEDEGMIKDEHPNAIVFSNDHAKGVVKFLDKIQEDKNDSVLVVHCHAGISRSGAVGTFACDYCGLDYLEFMDKNKAIQANSHVLRTLRNVANMTPDFGAHDGVDPNAEILYSVFLPLLRKEEKK